MITGTFSIVRQSIALGCFPRVTVRHTSAGVEGQVYLPEVNYVMMVLTVIVVAIFRTTVVLGNAYGEEKKSFDKLHIVNNKTQCPHMSVQ